jgi:mono/diheme cytochrome c family protein
MRESRVDLRDMIRRISILMCLTGLAPAARAVDVSTLPPATGQAVDFVRDIQPIFASNCVKCHGPEKQKSEYRLDVKSIALTNGENHAPNIVPGKSAESPLIHFVAGLVKDMHMPPKDPPLQPEQIGLLRQWIDDGAVWPDAASAKLENKKDWWSLKPPTKPPVPANEGNSIDGFISEKLKYKGLTMAPLADARTLIRRVYFDLTGLPPSPEEVAAFVRQSDPTDETYEVLVDNLLASPRYGERWARHWLDVVHFGETHGYDKDKPRPNAWPYRDYVIRAFNEDKPYSRFVQEQLAGDVLFPDTRDGIEALGFMSAGPWDLIGHEEVSEDKIDGQIARHLDRDDMVANAMGSFTSITVQCAQCHDHKFDPVTQQDYYSLQAVFAAVDRADKSYDLDPAIRDKRATLTAHLKELEAKENAFVEQLAKAAGPTLATLETQIKAAEKAASKGARPEYGWHSQIEKSADTSKWVQIDLGRRVALDHVVLAGVWDDFNGIGAGFGFPARFRIETSDDINFTSEPMVIAAQDLQDFANPGTTPQTFPAQGKSGRYLRVTATKLALRQNDYIVALSELQAIDTTGKNVALGAIVTSIDSIEAPVRWTRQNLTDGIYPAATGGGEMLVSLRQQRDSIIAKALDAPTKAARIANTAALATAKKDIAKLPPMQVVYAGTVHSGSGNFRGTSGKPRPIHLLARGQVTMPRAAMQPAALTATNELLPADFDLAPDAPEAARRAALAKWITDPRNPLTDRSIVNRVWLYHFGNGLVTTPNDFGRMGAVPTHPELLDWLAITFREDLGGSLKKLHKLLLTSATYRQSSSARNARAEEIDNGNALLWRQNRRKLEAEAVRDSVLAVSGKLDLKAGGPSWKDFVVERPEHSPHYQYDLADPNDATTWRRAIYRFIVRSQPQPFMTVLDCADPSMRVEKRNESVSPAQALSLLNNGFMVVQATHFAARLQAEAGNDPAAQIDLAYRLATGRSATQQEKAQLTAFVQQHGLANTCRVIFNLNEFTFID